MSGLARRVAHLELLAGRAALPTAGGYAGGLGRLGAWTRERVAARFEAIRARADGRSFAPVPTWEESEQELRDRALVEAYERAHGLASRNLVPDRFPIDLQDLATS